MIAIDDILAKGVALNDHLPVNIYKGNTKVAGWHPQTVSGEGTISLDGAYNVPPDALVIDGKCVQDTTTGKNLANVSSGAISFKYPATNPVFAGDSFSVVTTSDWGSDYIFFNTVARQPSFVISWFSETPSKETVNLGVRPLLKLFDATGTSITDRATSGLSSPWGYNEYYQAFLGAVNPYNDGLRLNTIIASLSPTVATVIFGVACAYSAAGATIIGNKIQLETGSTATAYEPYTGGIPSPNPSYPQPITTITGDMTITAANGDLSDTVVTPLGSVELCSLPDGTKDTYDAVTGVLTKRVDKVVVTGAYFLGTTGAGHKYVTTSPGPDSTGSSTISISPMIYSDRYNYRLPAGANNNTAYRTWNSLIIIDDRFADLATARAILAAERPTVYYELATPTTIQLTPDLPVVRTGIKTLSVSANITPSFTATVKAMD